MINILAKCRLETTVLTCMKRDLLFTSCNYLKMKKFVREMKVNLKYEKILNDVKVHNWSINIHRKTCGHSHNEPQLFISMDVLKKTYH